MMQFNIHGMRFLGNPDYTISFTPQGIFTWLALAGISACFISIFLIPSVLNRSIEETEKLQQLYEG